MPAEPGTDDALNEVARAWGRQLSSEQERYCQLGSSDRVVISRLHDVVVRLEFHCHRLCADILKAFPIPAPTGTVQRLSLVDAQFAVMLGDVLADQPSPNR